MKISPGGEREGAFLLLGTPHIVSDLKTAAPRATCLKTQDAWRWRESCGYRFVPPAFQQDVLLQIAAYSNTRMQKDRLAERLDNKGSRHILKSVRAAHLVGDRPSRTMLAETPSCFYRQPTTTTTTRTFRPTSTPASAKTNSTSMSDTNSTPDLLSGTCCSSETQQETDQQQPPPAPIPRRMGAQSQASCPSSIPFPLPQTLPPSTSTCTGAANSGIAKDAADTSSTTTSASSATHEAHRTLRIRGHSYPRAQHQFAFDASTPRSHWRRCNALSDNVAEYLAAHGLPPDRARRELSREYCQRYRFVRPVSESAGGGAVFEIDTDWERRVQVYEVDDGGWDEACADGSALFGGHARGPSSVAAAPPSSNNDKRPKRKIHRRSRWEGRSFIASTLSPNGGLIERTERYLTSAAAYLTAAERSGLLPPGTDDTIQVVERTYSPEGDGVPPEIVTCREVFVRCYHHPTHRGAVRPDHDESGGPCCSVPVRSGPFEDVVVASGDADGIVSGSSTSNIASFTKKDQVRVRAVLVPLSDSGCCDENSNISARRYRVCIEGDAVDVETRGLLGLLSDAVSELQTAQEVLETLDVATICQRVGIASAEPSRRRLLEETLRVVQKQIVGLLG